MKVMLTNADSRKTFDIFNILKTKKIDTILISERSNFLLRLAYRQKIFPSVMKFLENCNTDICFFPVSEVEIKKYYSCYSNNPYLHSILPEEKSFDLVRDKLLLAKYCLEVNVKVPRLISFNSINDIKSCDFPLVCKPRIGDGSLGVSFIEESTEILKLKYDSNYFFQKKIVSTKKVFGAFFFMQKGKVVTYYSHERLRTFPPSGGVSVLSKSTNNLELREIGERLLSSLNWSGIAMLEFMLDDIVKEYYLIEINPRVWGSFMLSEYCGARFIDSYIEALESEIIHKDQPVRCGKAEILVGKLIRWVFPWDFYLLLKKKVSLKEFFSFKKNSTCFINCSGSSFFRSLFVHMYYIFDISLFRKFIKKVRGSR